jgi:uncharacterized membrane protein YhhN
MSLAVILLTNETASSISSFFYKHASGFFTKMIILSIYSYRGKMRDTRVLSDIMAGTLAAAAVAAPMTMIDTGILRAQLSKTSLSGAIASAAGDMFRGRLGSSLGIMYTVYAGTYLTANMTEHACRTNNVSYGIPTFLATSFVNIALIGWKDRRFAEMLRHKKASFPRVSAALFAARDALTIGSSFVLKNDARDLLERRHGLRHETAKVLASFAVPMLAQVFSTPLHIAALDVYEKPGAAAGERLRTIARAFPSVCLGRVVRVIPAFGIGGCLNERMREKWEDDETVLEVEDDIRRFDSGRLLRRFTTGMMGDKASYNSAV